MDVSFELDDQDAIFTNGDTIFGQIILHCHNSSVRVCEISASLIGESMSILPDFAGLIMNRKEEERHQIVNVRESLLPCWDRRESTRVERLRLGKGYHQFDFSLKVPWILKCHTCPSSLQSSHCSGDEKIQPPLWPLRLPPSMELNSGARISYRVDVSVTVHQNLFKFTQRKTKTVMLWPVNTHHYSLSTMSSHQFPASKSITANILSPQFDQVPAYSEKSANVAPLNLESGQVLITAGFLPEFDISRGISRDVSLNLKIKQLQATMHSLYLQSFQILLFAYTDIHAGDKVSAQMSCWIVQSLSNLNMKLFSGQADGIEELNLNPALWKGKRLPKSAIPGFDACNLARRYEVEILLGLQYKDSYNKAGRISVTQLRAPVRVPSGVLPGQQKTKKLKDSVVGSELPIFSSGLGLGRLTTISENGMLEVHEVGVDAEVFPGPPTYEEATQFPPEKQPKHSKSLFD